MWRDEEKEVDGGGGGWRMADGGEMVHQGANNPTPGPTKLYSLLASLTCSAAFEVTVRQREAEVKRCLLVVV